MKSVNLPVGHSLVRMSGGRSNVYLLTCGQARLLIDTGCASNWPRLTRKLHRMGIDHVDWLLLTHTHFDHAANSHRLAREFGAGVLVHRAEAEYLQAGKNMIPGGTNFFSRFLIRCFGPKYMNIKRYQPHKADFLMTAGFSLKKYGFDARILCTPGHSPGSVSLICGDAAVVGDAVFGVFPGRAFPPFADDVELLLRSWERLLDSGCHWFFPGHGTAVSARLLKDELCRCQKLSKYKPA